MPKTKPFIVSYTYDNGTKRGKISASAADRPSANKIALKKLSEQGIKAVVSTGSGRPCTGLNTVNIGFSVHKDFAAIVKETVKQKIAELKAKQAAFPIHPSRIAAENPLSTTKSQKTAVKSDAVNQFLAKRRDQKGTSGKKNVKDL